MVFSRELTRRDFLKLSAGSTAALGLSSGYRAEAAQGARYPFLIT